MCSAIALEPKIASTIFPLLLHYFPIGNKDTQGYIFQTIPHETGSGIEFDGYITVLIDYELHLTDMLCKKLLLLRRLHLDASGVQGFLEHLMHIQLH